MRKRLVAVLFIFVIIAGIFTGCGKSSKKKDEDYKDISDKINKYVDTLAKDKKFSGAVLVAKGDKIVTKKTVGNANNELNVKNTPDTKFRIGNMTNQFTAAAILQIEDKGFLSIDDTVAKHIPNYPKGDTITIRELLNHTSGIPNYTNFEEYKTLPLQKIIDSFKYRTLEFTPGSKYKYSDSNYLLLGYIIEKVSGKSYSDYINENILKPLKLNNTGLYENDVIVSNRADGYEYNESGTLLNTKYQDPSRWYSASGIYSTIGDLYLWDRALNGDSIVSKKEKPKFLTPEDGKNYVCGWAIDSTAGHKAYMQNVDVKGYSGCISRYVKDNSVIIILSNSTINSEDIDKISSNIGVYLFQ